MLKLEGTGQTPSDKLSTQKALSTRKLKVLRMAKKTPRKQGKPNTLDAISGTDAIEVLRILANRDKKLAKEIDAIAQDLLAEVSIEEVADCVEAELESLAVEEVWDRSGARRDGYVDTGEAAWSFEGARTSGATGSHKRVGLATASVGLDGLFAGSRCKELAIPEICVKTFGGE